MSRPQRQRWVLGFPAALVGVVLSTGCYRYAPATLETVPVGSGVRVMLSNAEQEELLNRVGMNTSTLEGELLERTDDQLLVSVKAGEGSRALGAQNLYQRIDVSRQGVVRVDVREIDPVRTGGLVAILVGTSAVVISQAFGGSDPDRPDPNPGPDDSIVGWVLRIPIFHFE